MKIKDIIYYAKKCGLGVSFCKEFGKRRYVISRGDCTITLDSSRDVDSYLAGYIAAKYDCGVDVFAVKEDKDD